MWLAWLQHQFHHFPRTLLQSLSLVTVSAYSDHNKEPSIYIVIKRKTQNCAKTTPPHAWSIRYKFSLQSIISHKFQNMLSPYQHLIRIFVNECRFYLVLLRHRGVLKYGVDSGQCILTSIRCSDPAGSCHKHDNCHHTCDDNHRDVCSPAIPAVDYVIPTLEK